MCCDSHFLGRIGQPLHQISLGEITPTNTARTLDLPVLATAIEVPCVFYSTGGLSMLEELRVIEKVDAGADVRRPDLRAVFYKQNPGTINIAIPHDPDLTKYVGEILIKGGAAGAETPNVGWRRLSATKHEAVTVDPQIITADPAYSSLWLVLVADGTFTYAPGTKLYPTIGVSRHR